MNNNTELPIFNEFDTCPACGFNVIESRFWPAGLRTMVDVPVGPHVSRQCSRCKYVWYQAPLFTAGES